MYCDKKNRFLVLHIIHKCQLYCSQRVRAVFRGCATWGMPHRKMLSWEVSHDSKHVSDDILTCKQMYRKNRLYCFEVKRTLISQKKWPISFKWHEIWICESYNSEQPSLSIVVLGKQLNTPDSTATIKKCHWWRRIHVNKLIDCDRFRDDRVNKWGPTTTTSFAEAEERERHRAEKYAGTLGNWWDLDISNASLKGGFRREHKQWRSTMGKAPKPSAISSIDKPGQVQFFQWGLQIFKAYKMF